MLSRETGVAPISNLAEPTFYGCEVCERCNSRDLPWTSGPSCRQLSRETTHKSQGSQDAYDSHFRPSQCWIAILLVALVTLTYGNGLNATDHVELATFVSGLIPATLVVGFVYHVEKCDRSGFYIHVNCGIDWMVNWEWWSAAAFQLLTISARGSIDPNVFFIDGPLFRCLL
jgi:hypothetical protein